MIAPFLLCALLIQGPATQGSVVIDRILAVVAGQPILLSDVTAATEFQLVTVPPGTSDAAAYVLDRLIRRRLILAEVERSQPPSPDDVEITTRVNAMETRAGSPAAFDRELAVTGMTRDQLRRFIRDDLRMRTYLLERFGADRPGPEFTAAVDAWVAELRRRTQVTVVYPK